METVFDVVNLLRISFQENMAIIHKQKMRNDKTSMIYLDIRDLLNI